MTGIIRSSRITSGLVGRVQVVQRFAAIGDGRGVEAFDGEHLRHHVAQILVVFDDEHGTVVGSGIDRVDDSALFINVKNC